QLTSQRFVLHTTTTLNPSTISWAAPAAANTEQNAMKTTEMISGAKSTSLRSSDGTTFSSNESKNGVNNSTTNSYRSVTSSATFTTTADFSNVTKSAAAESAPTVTPNHSTATFTTPGASELPSGNSSSSPTSVLFPSSVTLTSPKGDSPTPNLNPTAHTTQLNGSSSSPSIAPPNPKDASQDKTNKEGVIVGVLVGAILGCALIGLVGYFICAMKRSEPFSHRRLYDDTRSDPVLHLDNSLEPYDTSFGGALDDKSSPADTREDGSAEHPPAGIAMAHLSPSHPPL
ncbi:MUC15 protein, partial [Malurus elegans]|nr:MUC15 protein [Malurus elegans]